jgi:aryl-alcohol dehydrogenase-like predicted oxidoreductase
MAIQADLCHQYSDRSVHLAKFQDTKLGSFLHYPVNYVMQYRKFGNTDLLVSEIGFGAWAIGGGAMIGNTAIGWGDADDTVSAAAVNASLDAGINFFDTADIYGLGHSEELLGRLISDRKDLILASKVGNVSRDEQFTVDYSREYILGACEQSLKRLKRDTIDFYQLHTARMTHLQQGDCIAAMQDLQQAGKIRYWGLSLNTFDPQPEAGFLMEHDFGNGFQLVLNLLNQHSLPLLRKAGAKGYGIIVRMPLQFGLLTGKFDNGVSFPENDHRKKRLVPAIVEACAGALAPVWQLCEKYHCTKTQLSLSYLLSYPEVSVIIPGIRTPEQVNGNTEGLFRLEEEDRLFIESMGSGAFVSIMQMIQQQG